MTNEDNVKKIYPVHAHNNPDTLLELSVGDFESVCILGVKADGHLTARATDNMTIAELVYYLERIKLLLLERSDGVDDDD